MVDVVEGRSVCVLVVQMLAGYVKAICVNNVEEGATTQEGMRKEDGDSVEGSTGQYVW